MSRKLRELPKPFFVLAPMDDVTDSVFRRMVASTAAPDVFFTEFANVDGLQSPGRARLLKKLRFTETEQPLVAHIWGLKPENFYKTTQEIADGSLARQFGLPEGVNFAGIDLNMGCPAKAEVKAGACSALINDRPLAHEIITATQEGAAGQLPVSVKTRLGFSDIDLSWHEFLLGHNLDMLTIHARTRKEMSKVPAHWEQFAAICELRDCISPDTLLVGNGDIMNREHGSQLAEQYGLDGVMIGRGVFQDPYAFAAASPWPTMSRKERLALYRRHVELFAETWQTGDRPIHTLNKFCKIYVSDFDGAKELREQLMAATSTDELLSLLTEAQTTATATLI